MAPFRCGLSLFDNQTRIPHYLREMNNLRTGNFVFPLQNQDEARIPKGDPLLHLGWFAQLEEFTNYPRETLAKPR
jgi:hypothetical protein